VLERPLPRGEGLHQQDLRSPWLFVEEDEQRRGRRAQAVVGVLLAVERFGDEFDRRHLAFLEDRSEAVLSAGEAFVERASRHACPLAHPPDDGAREPVLGGDTHERVDDPYMPGVEYPPARRRGPGVGGRARPRGILCAPVRRRTPPRGALCASVGRRHAVGGRLLRAGRFFHVSLLSSLFSLSAGRGPARLRGGRPNGVPPCMSMICRQAKTLPDRSFEPPGSLRRLRRRAERLDARRPGALGALAAAAPGSCANGSDGRGCRRRRSSRGSGGSTRWRGSLRGVGYAVRSPWWEDTMRNAVNRASRPTGLAKRPTSPLVVSTDGSRGSEGHTPLRGLRGRWRLPGRDDCGVPRPFPGEIVPIGKIGAGRSPFRAKSSRSGQNRGFPADLR
jgi:hypothetical protein